jgi:AcrR family transcriptional regulator
MSHHDQESRLISAALAVAAETGWNGLKFLDVAERAESSLSEIYSIFPSKMHLLRRIFAFHDQAVLADGAAEDDDPRDRLFDVVMRRFDALQAHREGLVRILRDLPTDPLTLIFVMPSAARSMSWLLEAAHISSGGFAGGLRVKGLGVVYANALRTWLDDDSPDMSKTMAAVDRDLRRADTLVQKLKSTVGNKPWREDRKTTEV